VVLLLATLRNQREYAQKDHFENKYFILIQLHRDNVNEIGIKAAAGRKVFVLLLREFRELLPIVHSVAAYHDVKLTQVETVQIAYYCFMFGTGPNSSRQLRSALRSFDRPFIRDLVSIIDDHRLKEEVRVRRRLGYVPFEGHQSRLGHYFRHLYQTIQYIDQQPLSIDKYEYVKTVRAQLSTHEQALLLLNSLTPLGAKWWSNRFICTYRLVQNLPRDFFDPKSEIDIQPRFKQGYFEWEDDPAGVHLRICLD
jgi:hypothetical protein